MSHQSNHRRDDDSVSSGYTAKSGQSSLSSASNKRDDGSPPDPNMKLNVWIQIKACRNLPIADVALSDPYVIVKLGKSDVHKTKTILKTLNPKFTEHHNNSFTLRCTVQELNDAKGLSFYVNDYNLVRNDIPLCKVRIPPKVFFHPSGELREFKLKTIMEAKKIPTIDLSLRSHRDKDKSAYIRLRMKRGTEPKTATTVTGSTDPATKKSSVVEKKKMDDIGFDSKLQQQKVEEVLGNNYKTKKIENLKIEIIYSTGDIKKPETEKLASETYTRVTINAEYMKTAIKSFQTARKKAPLFESVVFYYCKMSDTQDDKSMADEIKKHKNLRKVHFISSRNMLSKPTAIPPILEAVGELPIIEELELRMSEHQKELPRAFLKYISQYSKSLKSLLLANIILPELQMKMLFDSKKSALESLVLWNIKLDFKRLRTICGELKDNETMKRLEVWCSELGSNYGVILAEMLEANKSLETMVVSHVGMYGTSCIAIMDALESKNSTLRNLTLLDVAYNDKDTVSKAVMQMMKNNKSLQSLSVTYEAMKEEDCYELSNDIKRNMILRKFLQQKKELDDNDCICAVL